MTKRPDELSVIVHPNKIAGMNDDVPCGVKRTEFIGDNRTTSGEIPYYYPLLTAPAYNNLYGRVMTMLEATTDKDKLKVVKTLFQRELNDWFSDLEKSVKELDADHTEGHGYYYRNVYVYGKMTGRAISGDHPDLSEIDI